VNYKKNRLQEIVASAVGETFEEMAFLEVYQVEDPDELMDEESLLRASLLVHDPFPGELCLVAPRSLMADVAMGLFSLEKENIDDLTLFDLLAELLNTIAGKIMNQITPQDATFRLGLPETGVESLADAGAQTVEFYFDGDEKVFSVAASGDAFIAQAEFC